MNVQHTSRRRRAVAAASVVTALGVGGVALLAPSAQAAPAPVETSDLHWGFKQTFRSYITNAFLGGGTITPSDGASFEPTGSDPKPFVWSGAGGTYDADATSGTLDFDGTVVFSKPAHGIWHITIEDPTVVLDGDGTGQLLADVSYSTGGTQAAPENVGSDDDVHIADLGVPAPATSAAGTDTFTDVTATLTAEGSAAFNGQYAAGDALDKLTFSVATEDVPPTTTPPTTPPTTPSDPIGSLLASITSLLQSLLAGLGF